MPSTRASGRGDTAKEEEFLHQLYRGGELLAAGKVIEAKDHLEKAFTLQPKNEKGQNLLGLTYFKLGLFDRATEIYEALVRENPVDPTLRVNLGLVYLKTNGLQRAIREFETATDLAPDHKKAHNYLGLALAQAGDYGKAREHFLEAGSEAMAVKMAKALAGEGVPKPAPQPSLARQPGFAELEGGEGAQSEVWQSAPSGPAEVPAASAPPATEDAQIEVMSDEESPPPAELVVEAEVRVSPPAAQAPEPVQAQSLGNDWGAQFGFDRNAGAAPAEEEMRFATDEGPSAPSGGISAEADQADPADPAKAAAGSAEAELVGAPPAADATGAAAAETDFGSVQVPADSMDAATAEAAMLDSGMTAEVEFTGVPAAMPSEIPAQVIEGQPVVQAVFDVPLTADATPVAPSGSEASVEGQKADAALHEEAAESLERMREAAEGKLPGEALAASKPTEPPRGLRLAQPLEEGGRSADVILHPSAAAAAGRANPSIAAPFSPGVAPPLLEIGRGVSLLGEPLAGPFHVNEELAALVVKGEMLMRADGLVAWTGTLVFTPERKRFRGRATEKPFGEGLQRMMRAVGEGVAFVETGKRFFLPVDLADESGYFRDGAVFAFEEAVAFENGRVPAEVPPDLDLVHLRGDGKVLLALEGPLRSLDVKPEVPVTIPMTHLVGWHGSVMPRLVPIGWDDSGKPTRMAVELTGEGFALFSMPVG